MFKAGISGTGIFVRDRLRLLCLQQEKGGQSDFRFSSAALPGQIEPNYEEYEKLNSSPFLSGSKCRPHHGRSRPRSASGTLNVTTRSPASLRRCTNPQRSRRPRNPESGRQSGWSCRHRRSNPAAGRSTRR